MLMRTLRSVLVVCAHPDDEVLGAGGTMAWARRQSAAVHTVVLSCSVTSRNLPAPDAEATLAARRADASAAAQVLGATVETHDFPDNAFDTVPAREIASVVERAVRQREPDLVLTHWSNDLSIDHQLTARAALVACRPIDGRRSPAVASFEIRSSTDWTTGPDPAFTPSLFVGLDDHAWSAKLDALNCYASELRDAPHARSIDGLDALSRYRGTQVGLPRAEAFVLLRSVVAP